jgi:SMC interacting uncharacterized protein involved in chromosome segregation
MSELADRLKREFEHLETARDELRVKIHLARMEAQERFEQAEKSWHELEGKLKLIQRESEKPLHDVGEAARQLAQEIGEAYKSIRKLL